MDAKDLKVRFGLQVRKFRKSKGLTQEQLAEICQLSAEYASRIERGLVSPSFEVIANLSSAFSIAPSDLFDFSED